MSTLTSEAKVLREDINRSIEIAAKKRDHACDVLGKPLLGLTYQMEIDKLLKQLESLPS